MWYLSVLLSTAHSYSNEGPSLKYQTNIRLNIVSLGPVSQHGRILRYQNIGDQNDSMCAVSGDNHTEHIHKKVLRLFDIQGNVFVSSELLFIIDMSCYTSS